jgi:hypothetical protein
MKQVLEVRSAGTVPATLELDAVPAQLPRVISEAELDKISGGGGARGGVVQRTRND